MKLNDWIIANINNPDFTISDFRNIADMTSENTQLLGYGNYLEKEYIRNNDLFKDSQGVFNEDLFKNYYINKALEFQLFHENDYLDLIDYSIWDVRRTKDSKVKNPNLQFVTVHNPDRVAMGIEGLNVLSDPTKTVSELAQTLKVWDPEKGEYLNYTPNDYALFKEGNIFKNIYNYATSLFDDPLVIARYEEDGTHLENGREVAHKKGQYKLNDDGTYYTEKLNGRSVVGKEFISALDIITVDGSDVNKYDFFDADGMDKGAVGNTVKNLVAAAPLYFLGPTGAAIYGGVFVARELAKALPMLADVFTLFGEDLDSLLLNTIAAYGNKFTGSTSEYAKQNMFSYENFANLATDVALQWGQQKAIANTIRNITGAGKSKLLAAYAKAAKTYTDEASNMLTKGITGLMPLNEVQAYIGTSIDRLSDIKKIITSGEWEKTPLGAAALRKFVPEAEEFIAKRTRLGQDLSLAYMAIVSNTDVYESVLQHGGTQKEAASMALGSMLGMYGVDKFLGLGEMFFDDIDAQRMFRNAATKEADNIMNTIGGKVAETEAKETTKKLAKWIRAGVDAGKKTVKEYHKSMKDKTLGFAGKAVGEGLEEVSEELVTDLSKTLGEIAGEFGIASQTDYGAWDNPLERYTMSFLGGAVGGAMFYGINGSSNLKTEEELIYLIRNNKTHELLKELDKLYKKGKLASTTLSWKTSEGGTYISADKDNESQNDYVYKRLKESIILMDNIINENKLNLNENQMFDKLVLSEARYTKLRDYLQDASYVTGYQLEYQNMVKDIKNIKNAVDALNAGTADTDKRSNNPYYNMSLSLLELEYLQLIDKRNKFLNGEYSAHYLKKMLFAIDTNMNDPFISLNYNQWVRHNYGKDVKYLTEDENNKFREEWENYNTNSKKKGLSEAFRIYEEMEQEVAPIVEGLNEQDVISWGKIANKLEKESPLRKLHSWDDKLESETEEEFKNRNKQTEDEGEAQFNLRRSLRAKAIEEFNNENLLKWYEDFIQGQGVIDLGIYRKLLGSLSERKKDLYKHHKSNIYTLPVSGGEFDLSRNTKLNKEIFEILDGLKENNTDEIREKIKKKINDSIREELENIYKKQRDISAAAFSFKGGEGEEDAEGNTVWNFSPIEESLTKLHIFDYFTLLLLKYGKTTENPEEIKEFLLNSPGEYLIENDFYEFGDENIKLWIDEYLLYMFPQTKELAAIDFALAAGTITEEKAIQQRAALTVDTIEQLEMADDEFNEIVEKALKSEGKAYLSSIDENILKPILLDPWLKIIQEFEQKLKTEANPIILLLKVTNPRLGKNPGLEQLLEEIQQTWDNLDNPVDFELSTPQIDALKEAIQQLSYVKTFIYSASAIPNFVNPVGHNRALNEFAQKHPDKVVDWNPLPEISTDASNVYLSEIDRYIQEANFWIAKAYENAVNKKEEFKQTDRELLKTRLDFYKNNKFILSDGTNLLEGWDSDEESLSNLVTVDDILYNNFLKAIKEGKKEEDILEELLENITKVDNITQQITTPINRELSYARYSDYDKFTLLVSVLATKDSNFYKKAKNHIATNPTTKDGNKIASLSVQEYAERVVEASLKNPNFINKALEVVNSKSTIKLPIVKNATLITGLGGAGKTDVVVRASVSDIDPKDIWVSGPTDAQVLGLQEVIKGANGVSRYDLMSQIMGKEVYDNFLSELNKEHPNLKYFKEGDAGKERIFNLITSGIKFLDIDKKPKTIVIDEVTHFSGMELLLLGEWANLNNVNLILVGDENQKGFEGPGLNVDREKLLMWRAPRLGVSLRDATYQKVKNLQQVVNILEDLRTSLNLSPEKLHEVYNQQIPNIEFKYYLDNGKFSGELITKDITPNITKLLKGKVGYVGLEDDVYKALKDLGVDVQLFPADKIQGREFNYVVINKEWKAPELDETGTKAYRFLQDLYTMMSRSKEGTIFIDNGLSDIIGNKQETVYARVTSVREAAEEFNNYKLQELENIKFEETPAEVMEIKEVSEDVPKKGFPVNPDVDTGEEEEQNKIKNEKSVNIKFPIRVYGNIHLLGISSTPVKVDGKEENEWKNKNDSHLDIGIFLRSGEKIIDGKKKDELVKQLLDLKSVVLFGVQNHEALNTDLRIRFTKESFDSMQYYIQVRDDDHLIGMTNLDLDKLKLNGKVITIVGKLKDNTGEEYSITLGALASPDKWEENKNNIISAIKKRLEKEPSEDLLNYIDNFEGIIQSYRNRLSELSKVNQEVRIKKPDFTAMTELIFKDSDGNRLPNIRLEEIDSDKQPWTYMNPYAIVSDNYVLIDDIPGSNLKKGVTVRYVSANTLLSPDLLEEKYWRQKTEGGIPQVRLLVLKNEGVSFRSLYAKKYKDLYSTKIGNNLLTFPINLQYQSMNMYRSIWNFRSNLIRFNNRLQEWMSSNSLTNADVEELIKLDAQEYNKISKDLGIKYLSEKEFREKSENKDKLEKLWKFNDSLADSVRLFRLGYSTLNGAYLRTLTNITADNQFYKKVKNPPVGIYITPDLAKHYLNTLDSLFKNFLDKIIINPFENPETYIEEYQEGWFNELKSGKISLKLYDIQDNEMAGALEVAGAEKLKAIPILLTEMAKYINYYSQGKEEFLAAYANEKNEDDGSIKLGLFKVMLGDEEINYIDIFDPDGNTLYETQDGVAETIPGVHTFTTKEGAEQTMDFRLNNLWDLMFHGSIENATKNDFTNVEWVATDAYFKDGISHEPIMFARKGDSNEEKHSVAIASSKKFFSTDTGVGFPLFYANLDEYTEESKEVVEVKPTETTNIPTFELTPENITILGNIGFANKELTEINSIEEAINLVNKKIKNNIVKFFDNGNQSTPIDLIPYEAKLDEAGNIQIVYLTDKYSELKKDVVNLKWNEGLLTLERKDGTHMTVLYVEDEIVISEVKQNSVNDDITSGQEIVNVLKSFVETYKDAFKSPDVDIISDEEIIADYINNINEAFDKFDLPRPLNPEDLLIALNTIDLNLEVDESLEEGLNNPYNVAISQIKKAIQELKLRYCRV